MILICSITFTAIGQVSINNDNDAPDPSAMLDVKSTDRGFLPPRMTTEQMNSIITPLEGLLVYNISVNSLYWFNGTTWKRFNEFSFNESDPVFAIHPANGISSVEIGNWNTAYGWGNHAAAGYLTGFTETDPVFSAHPAYGITNSNISSWNLAYSNRITGASGTAPLSLSIARNLLTGSMTAANSTTNGYLTSIDWNTFNSKQNALILGSVSSSDITIAGGTNAVIGSGLNLTITKGSLTSSDLTITGGTNAVLGSGTALTVKKGNLTEATSSVLTITGGTNATLGTGTTIQVKQATTSQSGYLTSTDWNTFNNKQSTLTFGNLTSSDITVTGGGSAVKGTGTTLAINKGNLTSSDITVTGGSGSVLGTGATLSVNKGNLTETGSSVLTINNGNNAVLGSGSSIQVKPANASQSGYLSTADWNSFNNKISSQWTANGAKLHYNTGNVGVGTSNPQSKMDISGNAVIGSSYSGNNAAPANGLLVEGNVGVGTTAPATSAVMELKSTSQGFLPPRMTMAQRDAIASPADGLMVFCLDCQAPNNLQIYFTGKWYPMAFNRFPYATNVTQTGIIWDGNPLTGDYTYHDADNDPQGVSTFKWYRADNASGLNELAISGATSQIYTLTINDTAKYVRFAVIPVAGSGASPGEEVISSSFIGPISACGTTFTDSRDGQIYSTVRIGSQCWFAKNLNFGTMINNNLNQTNNSIIEKYCYNNNTANCAIYGGLYQWDELMNYTTSSNANPSGRQGICPTGWHIPSDAEWCQLETYLDATVNCTVTGWLGTDVGGKMKEAGTSHWTSPNTGATNSSGFTVLPGGYGYIGGGFNNLNYAAGLWSSAAASSSEALMLYLYHSYSQVHNGSDNKLKGNSGRCCKD